MAKDLPSLRKFFDRVEREVLTKQSNTELAKAAQDIIFKRVKSGFGVTNDLSDAAIRRKLKPLSPGYIEQRRKRGVTGKFGSPGISNLTNTGQMLDSMTFKANNQGFRLEIPGTRRRTRRRTRRTRRRTRRTRRRDGETNKRVADFVRKDRPFFALTIPEVRILEKIVNDKVLKIFKRTL